jgi:colanic acid biosynthesis protein WcaH
MGPLKQAPALLSEEAFTAAVKALPLVSIDLCLTTLDRRLLLGLRHNAPARGYWFTPGGRIRKGEPLAQALRRTIVDEIGNVALPLDRAVLMGAWDHFYPDSAFSPAVTTHYVNLPHWIALSDDAFRHIGSLSNLASQHSDWQWMAVREAAVSELVHPYVRVYADWLAQQG